MHTDESSHSAFRVTSAHATMSHAIDGQTPLESTASVYATLWIVAAIISVGVLIVVVRTYLIIRQYGPPIRRIFEEDPIFVPAEGSVAPSGEEIELPTPEGLTLKATYLAARAAPARGVVVFCHEFRSNRWSAADYCGYLQDHGFDVFTFDFRNHGESDKDPAYAPRHWVTNYELDDLRAALTYLTKRTAGALPIGLFGISRGGGTAIAIAARDRGVRCVVTDGAFPTHGTMLVYMRKWITLVVGEKWWARILPDWYLAFIRDAVLSQVERDMACRFARLERAIRRLAPTPILMIHGGRDSYIRPDIARGFFECGRDPREFWLVEGARHNACLEKAGDEYRRRVLAFFTANLT